jgi:hypothetical protein
MATRRTAVEAQRTRARASATQPRLALRGLVKLATWPRISCSPDGRWLLLTEWLADVPVVRCCEASSGREVFSREFPAAPLASLWRGSNEVLVVVPTRDERAGVDIGLLAVPAGGISAWVNVSFGERRPGRWLASTGRYGLLTVDGDAELAVLDLDRQVLVGATDVTKYMPAFDAWSVGATPHPDGDSFAVFSGTGLIWLGCDGVVRASYVEPNGCDQFSHGFWAGPSSYACVYGAGGFRLYGVELRLFEFAEHNKQTSFTTLFDAPGATGQIRGELSPRGDRWLFARAVRGEYFARWGVIDVATMGVVQFAHEGNVYGNAVTLHGSAAIEFVQASPTELRVIGYDLETGARTEHGSCDVPCDEYEFLSASSSPDGRYALAHAWTPVPSKVPTLEANHCVAWFSET